MLVLHRGKYFNLLCTDAQIQSSLLRAATQHKGSLSEVSLHMRHHLGRAGR